MAHRSYRSSPVTGWSGNAVLQAVRRRTAASDLESCCLTFDTGRMVVTQPSGKTGVRTMCMYIAKFATLQLQEFSAYLIHTDGIVSMICHLPLARISGATGKSMAGCSTWHGTLDAWPDKRGTHPRRHWLLQTKRTDMSCSNIARRGPSRLGPGYEMLKRYVRVIYRRAEGVDAENIITDPPSTLALLPSSSIC